MKVLFALNQNNDKEIETNILKEFKDRTSKNASFAKEYDTDGVKSKLNLEEFDILILNEDLERDESIYTSYVDEITDNHPDLRIIFLANSEHEGDLYVKKLFNIGVYDVIYAHDVSIDELVKLMTHPRTKAEAKEYLSLSSVEDVVMVEERSFIPEEQFNNIVNHLLDTEAKELTSVYEHIYKQYNKMQMVYLYKNLPKEIIEELTGFPLFDDIAKIVNPKAEIEDNNTDDNKEENTNDENTEKEKKIKIPKLAKIKNQTTNKTQEKDTFKGRIIGSVYIGVANVSRGAGSSYIALSMASYIASVGNSVCVLENNDYPVFSNMSKDKASSMLSVGGVDIYYMDKNKDLASQESLELKKDYQYIISDLGIIKSLKNNIYTNNDNYKEFIRSAVKVLALSGLSYKWGEIYPYLVSEDISSWKLLASPTSKNMKKIIAKELSEYSKSIHFLEYCDDPFSPSEELKDIYRKTLGNNINNGKKKKLRIPGFGFGKII